METTPFIPFLTLLEKNMPFYMSTIGTSVSHAHVYRPNGIEDCQLLYIADGVGKVIIDGTTYDLKEKSVLYIPSYASHNYYPTTNMWTTKYITFGGSGISDFSTMPILIQNNTSDFDFSKWYKILYKYKYTPNHEKSLSITLYATLLDFKTSISLHSSAIEAKKNMLMSAIHDMTNNYEISLNDVAKKLNMTEEHFCRTFKSYTGMRPLEYLNFLKIQRAKELLKNTEMSIAKIAELAGYLSQSYFTMLFKRYTGTTPKKYRNS